MTDAISRVYRRSPLARTLGFFLLLALVALILADIEIATVDPWQEFGRLALGVVTPDFTATEHLLTAIAYTVGFALLGVTFAVLSGFALALAFRNPLVRGFCAVIRAVHELFWALIFLQIFGLSPLTGVLAIGIPYAGIVAKVFAEILEEADTRPAATAPAGSGALSVLLFVRLPDVWSHYKTYALYRLECGLRSSAVLGYVGLPGTVATVQLTMIALVVTGLLSALLFPLISPLLFGRISRTLGHLGLVVMRSSPEYILAFILLQLWGPSIDAARHCRAVPAQWRNHRASGRALYGNPHLALRRCARRVPLRLRDTAAGL